MAAHLIQLPSNENILKNVRIQVYFYYEMQRDNSSLILSSSRSGYSGFTK